MAEPKVYNKHHRNAPAGTVYIGRGSKWGNPFAIGEHGSRADVIALYEAYIQGSPELLRDAKVELKGKNLVCYCKPAACHGDLLLEIANS